MSAITDLLTATPYVQGAAVYTNHLAGTQVSTIDHASGRAMYENTGRVEVSAPTSAPAWNGPPAQSRTPFTIAGIAQPDVVRGLRVEDEMPMTFTDGLAFSAFRAVREDCPDVPEPGLLVLLALGCAGIARRVRRA